MTEARIDRAKLKQMLQDGKRPVDCARFFGVSKPAISKAIKVLNAGLAERIRGWVNTINDHGEFTAKDCIKALGLTESQENFVEQVFSKLIEEGALVD
jgi:predicted transcriptional regulator